MDITCSSALGSNYSNNAEAQKLHTVEMKILYRHANSMFIYKKNSYNVLFSDYITIVRNLL